MRLLPLVGLLAASPALAFTEPDSGAWLGAAGGLAIHGDGIGPGWEASGGLWFGKHDAAYAIGKYTGLGITARQGWIGGDLFTEPLIEGRFGADIVAVTTQVYAAVGPHLRPDGLGFTAVAGAGLKYRVTARFGITGRFGVGARVFDGTPTFQSRVVFGVEWASPWERRE